MTINKLISKINFDSNKNMKIENYKEENREEVVIKWVVLKWIS